MGFLDKFIEPVNETPEVPVYLDSSEKINAELNLEGGIHTESLICDIYDQNDLSDVSKSIFKVEEVIASLPKEMATETKKSTVQAILGSFGLTASGVSLDGENRIGILNSVVTNINSESEKNILEWNGVIENYKKEIENYEKLISEAQSQTKESNELVSGEVTRIKGLIEFIGGGL